MRLNALEGAPAGHRRGMYPFAALYLTLGFVFAVVAFWPSYFSQLATARVGYHVHGITAVLWLAMLIGQVVLARRKRLDLHRAVGRTSYVLAPLFVVGGVWMVHSLLQMTSPFTQAFGVKLAFYDLAAVAHFAVAYGLAVTVFRRRMKIHARLMISTVIPMLFPVIGRLMLFYQDFGLSPYHCLVVSLVLTEAVIVALIYQESRRGDTHWPYPALLVVASAQHLGFVYADRWVWWQDFVGWYAGL